VVLIFTFVTDVLLDSSFVGRRLVLVAMSFFPIVDISMASIHSGFPVGAQLAFPLPSPETSSVP
jgi:hypothetical protein